MNQQRIDDLSSGKSERIGKVKGLEGVMSCYCDYERPSFCHVEMRKARKVHKCLECGHVIAIGEVYEHVRGKWEGDIDSFNTCERCVELRTAIADYYGGCFQYGGLFEEYAEYLWSRNGPSGDKCSQILIKHREWKLDKQSSNEAQAE